MRQNQSLRPWSHGELEKVLRRCRQFLADGGAQNAAEERFTRPVVRAAMDLMSKAEKDRRAAALAHDPYKISGGHTRAIRRARAGE